MRKSSGTWRTRRRGRWDPLASQREPVLVPRQEEP